jgi:dTDP-4-dehydrorhamnose 3,5-epimerase
MKFVQTGLAGVWVIELDVRADKRGAFARTFCKREFADVGLTKEFVQLNHSWNLKTGTLRGLHFQIPPYKEGKLVRCIRGHVFDVVVDLRKGSPTFLRSFSVELSERNFKMIYIPEGFAHGFQTLEDNCELFYHHTEYYAPGHEGGIRYSDPILKIDWPLPVVEISDRDLHHPLIEPNFAGLS